MSLAPPPLQPALPVPPTLTDQAAEPPAAARARFDNAADHPADSATGAAAAATPSPIHNPRLRQLLDLALAENRDLRLAMLAVERARAQYGIAQAERLPTLNANANANRSRSADDLTTPGRSNFSAQYSASVGLASYEIDFWGRVRQLNEAALQEFFRSQSTRDSARISLSAELMLAWLNLDADARRLQLAQATLQARQQQHALLTRSHALGAASALTLAQSQTSLDSARTDLASLQAQLARGRNALALLAGSPVPGAWLPPSAESAFAALAGVDGNAAAPAATAPAGTASSPASSPAGAPIPQPTPASAPALALPAIEPGMPSTLLLARPDVRAAEHGLKAASAQIGVARAAFFPSISLTASLGSASNQLSGLFAGGNGTWSFAPQIRLPIFDAGRNQANLRVAELARETALAHYENHPGGLPRHPGCAGRTRQPGRAPGGANLADPGQRTRPGTVAGTLSPGGRQLPERAGRRALAVRRPARVDRRTAGRAGQPGAAVQGAGWAMARPGVSCTMAVHAPPGAPRPAHQAGACSGLAFTIFLIAAPH